MTAIPLEITPALISDDTPFSSPGYLADSGNVRPHRGRPQTIGGWTLAFGGVEGICRNVLGWTDNIGAKLIACGTHSHLQIAAGGMLYDITPEGLAPGAINGIPGVGYGAGPYSDGTYGTPRNNAAARTWSLSAYGQSLMACPRGQTIYWWQNDPETPAEPLENAPEEVTYMLVTAERCVMAFGCNEEVSGTFNPLCVRWSDFQNPTDWSTGTADNAGEYILPGGGRIVGAARFGVYILIWTDNSVYRAQPTGNTGQPYRFDRIADNHGLIGPNAMSVLGQTVFWIAPDCQFRVMVSGGEPTVIPCPIRNDFKDNLSENQGDKIAATTITQYGEIWWFYPDSREGRENSRYVAYSTAENAWFRGEIARTAAMDAGVAQHPLFVSPDGDAFFHENGRSANGDNLSWFLVSSDQYIDEADTHMMIRGVKPDFEDQAGGIRLTVNTRPYPQGTVTAKGPMTIAPSISKLDFRASGCVFSIRLEGSSNPSFMRLGKPVFDAVSTGQR